ncbi:MAG: hypothetical protein R3D98_05190 [Candidatus Krumholzibacteriia bacterium]
MLFEGTEKKFEIMTAPGGLDLRSLGHDLWRRVIHASRAEPLSYLASDELEAWLLSESSLFVSAQQAVMITCGRTTLIDGLMHLLEVVPREAIASLIYERKNENFPDEQPSRFRHDCARLTERLGGEHLKFGDPDGDHISLYHLGDPAPVDPEDTTLEVLMHGIRPDVADLFVPDGPTTDELHARLGLDRLLAGFEVDDWVFSPQGYSLNALRGRRYATMHVTPERENSYASFELGWGFDGTEADAAVASLLQAFGPERVDLLLFTGHLGAPTPFPGYHADHDRREALSCGYPVHYRHLVRS